MPQKKEAEVEFFDKFGSDCGYDVLGEHGYRRLINEFLDYMGSYKKEKGAFKIIDVGCGTGAFTSRIKRSGFDLMALDISPKCIEYARAEYPDIEFIVGDIEKTDFSDETFDVIFLSGILHHFPDISVVLNECRRILKKDGIILGYDPNRSNPFMWMCRAKESPFYSTRGITENERLMSPEEIRAALASCNFSEFDVYGVSGITYRYINNKFYSMLLPVYNIVEKLIDLTPLRYKLGSMLITYAKK